MKCGYRQMLRDRMPLCLDLALRWCKAKERWIDLVYNTIIKRHPQQQRSRMVKVVLGIKQPMTRGQIYDQLRYSELKNVSREQVNNIPKEALFMSFWQTINYAEKLKSDDPLYDYWSAVYSWVEWFKKMYKYIENSYEISKKMGNSDAIITAKLISEYKISSKLADFLIKSFK